MVNRREFLGLIPAAAGAMALSGPGAPAPSAPVSRSRDGGRSGNALARTAAAPARLETFDYGGVRLLESPWRAQYLAAREFYHALPDDDILHGYRERAGLPAPGRELGGWARPTTGGVFGQWLSGMSQMYRATGDAAMRDKAVHLFAEWARALPADADTGSGHYGWDKLVCGLVDLARYAGHEDAIPVLERMVRRATRALSRENRIADPSHNRGYGGTPWEWYTLSENLYRAYQLTGNPLFREFAGVWHYTEYWGKFAVSAEPADAHGTHAYSHVNTFSSACAAHEVTGDAWFLTVAKNAYDWLQNTQCYCTGGYGPNERLMAPDGSLGRALDTRSDTTEIGCGSWAGFKLARHLMRATGEARYGDWIERLLYNGAGAMLPLTGRGRNFYYADYRVGGGIKVYNWDTFTCCSGTYIQNVAAYHDLIYFHDDTGVCVNLYVPSELTWRGPVGEIRLVQETRYPDDDTITLTLALRGTATFPLRFRVPGWSRDVTVRVNDAATAVLAEPGSWAAIERAWTNGDRIEIRVPLRLRMEAVDRHHPDRVAVMQGPVVLALEGAYHDPYFRLPMQDDDLAEWLVPEAWSAAIAYRMPIEETSLPRPTIFRVVPPDRSPVRLRFRPFYDIGEGYPYFIYFDRRQLPWKLW
ncbi:MAG: glycoside hydrolase family 127 protein [Gemmatimonadetes bacterium]|nr:glycoside hydrolase family 127 protein [Gemmatimonadota bacterium]